MHSGPGADLYTMISLRRCADQFTLAFYGHRGNGRSEGAEATSLNMENLTADADALRQALGFETWAVLGHAFGGYVAMEYALRYPETLSHLLLLDTGAVKRLAQENAPKVLAERGFSPNTFQIRPSRLWGGFRGMLSSEQNRKHQGAAPCTDYANSMRKASLRVN
jgi:proline iminopeptidase